MERSGQHEGSAKGPDGRERIRDNKSGVTHEIVYRNAEFNERSPVVVYLGLGTTALTSAGQLYLDAYMEKIERPIINVDTPVRAFASFDQQTESQLRVLRQYGVEQFDAVGSSSGAIAAAYLAAHAQSDVEDLVTISIPNTRANITDYARHMPAQFADGIREFIAVTKRGELSQVVGPRASNLFNIRKIPELIHTTKEIFATSLNDMPAMLAASTHWTDIAGMADKITDYKDHLRVVRERNEVHDGSSTSYLVADQGHAWVLRRAYLADIISSVLDKK
jgi:pimeloyl-ACP methyl ester carboxylesterase